MLHRKNRFRETTSILSEVKSNRCKRPQVKVAQSKTQVRRRERADYTASLPVATDPLPRGLVKQELSVMQPTR